MCVCVCVCVYLFLSKNTGVSGSVCVRMCVRVFMFVCVYVFVCKQEEGPWSQSAAPDPVKEKKALLKKKDLALSSDIERV